MKSFSTIFTSKRHLSIYAGIVILTFLAYGAALSGRFVWDDNTFLSLNAPLYDSSGALKAIWMKPELIMQYYPLTFTAFYFQYHLWGLNPLPYHVVNVGFHAINSCLLGAILEILGVPFAFLAALIFSLHPIQVESVAWISELKNLLSSFFFLSALLLYLRLKFHAPGRRAMLIGYPVIVVLFLMALTSKTVTCCFPVVVLLVLWWKEKLKTRDFLLLAPLFLISLLFGLGTVWMERTYAGAEGLPWKLNFFERILVAGRAFCFYLEKLVWPYPLCFVYPRWTIQWNQWNQWLFPLFVASGIVTLAFLRRRIGNAPLASSLMFAAILFPALGFFSIYPMRYSFVADHFQYLACAVVVPWFAVILGKIPLGIHRRNNIRAVIILVVLSLLGWRVWVESHKFHDNKTLWLDTIRKNPDAWMPRDNLAEILLKEGHTNEAVDQWRAAIETGQSDYVAYLRLGDILMDRGGFQEALGYYQQAAKMNAGMPPVYSHMAKAYLHLGDFRKAEVEFKTAIQLIAAWRLEPHGNYSEREASRYQEAMDRDSLASMYMSQKRSVDAYGQIKEAIALEPESASLRSHLGIVLESMGNKRE